MDRDRFRDVLIATLPAGTVELDPDVIDAFSRDESAFCAPGRPWALVRPTGTEQVAATVRVCAEHGVPIVPRGAGTGVAGGAVAGDGCVILCVTRMNRIVDIDTSNLLAVVEPGVLNAELCAAAAEHGLWYPPDPASRDICSIGGNVATNAGGLCCVKYGVTREYVLGLEVVLADGSVVEVGRRTVKGVAGYDLTALFVGSEGTLGIVTRVTLRLRPPPPPAVTLTAFFDSLPEAGRAISAITAMTTPSLLEIMDATTVAAVEDWKRMDLDTGAAALILAQSDNGTGAQLDAIAAAARSAGATFVAETDDPDAGEQLLTARRLAYPALARLGTAIMNDVCVPLGSVAAAVTAIAERTQRHGVRVGTFGHAGDGNLHPTIVFDRTDPDSASRGEAAYHAMTEAALDLGGTITGEHGVGLLKRPHLARELGKGALGLHAAVKAALDPEGILNPGKIFDL
ncbi:MAG: FAD-binding protein [Acidimicrobiia bacterium]|nr:FAD-binding protein [Acidimicrobiia bacterium]